MIDVVKISISVDSDILEALKDWQKEYMRLSLSELIEACVFYVLCDEDAMDEVDDALTGEEEGEEEGEAEEESEEED